MNKLNDEQLDVIQFILKKYKILISFEDDSYKTLNRRAVIDETDTLRKWKEKVFGDPRALIYIWGEMDPPGQTRFSNIREWCNPHTVFNLVKIIKLKMEENKDDEILNIIELKDKEKSNIMSTLANNTIESTMDESSVNNINLEDSVKERLSRLLSENKDSEGSIIELIKLYNGAVKQFRALQEN